jgi:hypothetical protein
MSAIITAARFRLGRIVTTANALETLTQEDILIGIQRHQDGDWGELEPEDKAANEMALIEGTRLLSAYRSANGRKFWIITEADRSVSTVLLPEDY